MIGLFILIFVSGLISGFVYGWFNQFSGLGLFIPVMAGGFIGSSVVAALFTYLYFTQIETDKEKIKKLRDEIALLKNEKY